MNSLQKYLIPVSALLLVLGFFAASSVVTVAQEQDVQEQRPEYIDELLKKASEKTGMQIEHSVKVKTITKADLREYVIMTLDFDYPGDDFEYWREALVMWGLLPEDYDLRTGLIDLMTEQAAAFYDPLSRTYYAISDLPDMLKVPMVERMLAAHELTHALQDQALDLRTRMLALRDDADQTYALQSLIEGQAVIAMYEIVMGSNSRKMPDIGAMMRMSMEQSFQMPEMKELAAAPTYLREILISPYAEGSDFVQKFLRENPDAKLAAMFERLPVSGEQVLHYELYKANDVPHRYSFDTLKELLAVDWPLVHENILGEYDLRVLFSLYDELKDVSVDYAAGWDGVHFAIAANGDARVLISASTWDSGKDAEEFVKGMKVVLADKYSAENSIVQQDGRSVFLLAGDLEEFPQQIVMDMLKKLSAEE